jgi:hypothetical protein
MGRNHLWYRRGDAANAILAAVGYNSHRLIRWLELLFTRYSPRQSQRLNRSSLKAEFFTDDSGVPVGAYPDQSRLELGRRMSGNSSRVDWDRLTSRGNEIRASRPCD